MNTPAHLIFGIAAFGRADNTRVTFAAVLGALFPDLSLYVMAGVAIYIMQISPRVVFNDLYYSDQWQFVFGIDNSFILWTIGAAFAVCLKSAWGLAFCGSALLHLVFDFLLHNHDARMHFWPISDWRFFSPFSYWDHSHYGGVLGPVEMIICLVFSVILLARFKENWMRLCIVGLTLTEVLPDVVFRYLLS